jgi:hypothetical protein
MLYCSVNEAYDNVADGPPDSQPHTAATYNTPYNAASNKQNIMYNVNNTQVPTQKYFSAQGDYENNYYDYGNKRSVYETAQPDEIGTTISALKHLEMEQDKYLDSDLLESSDSFTCPSLPKPKQSHSHSYYIDKFINTLSTDDSVSTVGSFSDDSVADTYNHVRRCKFCRTEINKRMRSLASLSSQSSRSQQKEPKLTKPTKPKVTEGFDVISSLKTSFAGYELKEIVIIILVGLIIIFILDLFVKIGRKTNKLVK